MSQPGTDRAVLTVAMIARARSEGLTWAQIGSVTIGRRDAKAAKAHAKRLARDTNRHLARQEAAGA